MKFKKYSLIFRGLLLASSMNLNLEAAEKKYPCTYEGCSSTFECPSHLTRHYRTHTGERPYPCDHPGCVKNFARKEILKIHYRTHTGERPYACDHPSCDMKFASKNILKLHYRTHTGERPYACDHSGCDMRFAQSSTLRRHLMRCDAKKPKVRPVKNHVVTERNPALDVDDDLLDIENLSTHQDFDDLIGPVSDKDLKLPDNLSDDEIVAPSLVTKKAKVETVLPLLIMKSPIIDE